VRATGGTVEVLLLKPAEGELWEALVRPARRVRPGERLHSAHPAGDDLVVEMTERVDLTGGWLVRLHAQGDPASALGRHGTVPLPPYIRAALTDPERYQTVYARRPGSVAAPTAGLHFTPELMSRLEAKGIGTARLELVVGLDTFRPITVDDPADHVMHGERYTIPEETIEACERAERVVAVGTTAVRALESAAIAGTREGVTELFIRRGHHWRVVDLLLTNFHVPRSTLLLLVDAFVGDRWRTLYRAALDEGYRFLSFGDAMLLDRHA